MEKDKVLIENEKIRLERETKSLRSEVERFSEDVLKRLYVLNYAPNGMWTYFVSVYYLSLIHI